MLQRFYEGMLTAMISHARGEPQMQRPYDINGHQASGSGSVVVVRRAKPPELMLILVDLRTG